MEGTRSDKGRLFLMLAITFLVIAVAVGVLVFSNGATSGQATAQDGTQSTALGASAGVSSGSTSVADVGGVQAASLLPAGGHPANEIGEGVIASTLAIVGGKVGIGVSVPSSKLDVAGEVRASSFALADGTIIAGAGASTAITSCPVGMVLIQTQPSFCVDATSRAAVFDTAMIRTAGTADTGVTKYVYLQDVAVGAMNACGAASAHLCDPVEWFMGCSAQKGAGWAEDLLGGVSFGSTFNKNTLTSPTNSGFLFSGTVSATTTLPNPGWPTPNPNAPATLCNPAGPVRSVNTLVYVDGYAGFLPADSLRIQNLKFRCCKD